MIKSIKRILATTLAVGVLAFSVMTPASAAGVSKTATYCSGGTSTTYGAHSPSWVYDHELTGTCRSCGAAWSHGVYYCNFANPLNGQICNATGYGVQSLYCSCGQCIFSGTSPTASHQHVTQYGSNCSHGNSSSHYYDIAYGYKGSSSTFTVYPLIINYTNGVTADKVTITNQTATDYAMSGRKVTITFKVTSTVPKVNITGTNTATLAAGTTTYSFTMPAKDVEITIGLDKQQQSISVQSTYNISYNTAPFNLNAQVTS